MEWCETVVHTTGEGQDVVSELMMRLGAAGTQIVDRADIPDPSKPGVYWELYDAKLLDDMPQDVLVKGWFALDGHTRDALAALREQLCQAKLHAGGLELGTLETETRSVEDADWAECWKKTYKPFRVGERIVVKPTWESYAARDGDLVIEMDPGMAFGTGTHETTHMCLELLEKHMKPGARVMDVGTGSGILAIAAAKLGASAVLGVDIDPDAVKVARENIARNGAQGVVRAVVGDLVKGEAERCELATANIVADAIQMLLAPIRVFLENGGLLVCSGIIREREQDVLDAARAAGYTVFDRLEMGEWVALCLRSEG